MIERKLNPADLPALLSLQTRVKSGMAQDDWLFPCEEEELSFILNGGGYALGLFEEEELLGAWLLYYPIGRDDGLGGQIGLDPEKVAHFELALLDERLRGRGLHAQMAEKLTAICQQDGRFTHILMTAHPDNLASLRAFTNRGYTVAATRELYGGVLRSIAVKALQET